MVQFDVQDIPSVRDVHTHAMMVTSELVVKTEHVKYRPDGPAVLPNAFVSKRQQITQLYN